MALFKMLFPHIPGGTEENHKNFRYRGLYFNPKPPQYLAGVTATWPQWKRHVSKLLCHLNLISLIHYTF
jgi:hypothetical protein